ncbi:hypothetical protein GF342_05965 [Candidatus Woesearchaeota archaeon]|nr:hypothetical protein [Candidatus Woesearchaeota archaeon]
MPEQTVLAGVIEFMARLGVYDVVLPFLLVFTIMYAILEKTKVLGTEKWNGEDIPRKNLNAMASFVVAFLVVASSQIVSIITEVSAKVVVLLVLVIFFLMLIGTFYGKEEEVKLENSWRTFFMVVLFIGIALIFADAIVLQDGTSVLEWLWGFIASFWTSAAAASVIFILLLIGFMYYITSGESTGGEADKGGKKE